LPRSCFQRNLGPIKKRKTIAIAKGAREDFLAGVIEGFYGQPWTQSERLALFEWLADWGLNTYVYAPKDDLNHRAIWREPYSTIQEDHLKTLIQACRKYHLRFIYALSPGLDIRYGSNADLDRLRLRFAQMIALGCLDFALLFDDIPDRLGPEKLKPWGSLAAAQCSVANVLFRWTRAQFPQARFLFCPTPYCGRMAERKVGGADYLETLGRDLLPEIDVFWTGPEIISQTIPIDHVRSLRKVLRRKPVLWDNLHANDYDGRRFYCGPYAGRPLALRKEVRGLLCNPNCEFPLNYVPLRTLAEFTRCPGSWNPRRAYLSAMRAWLPQFATIGKAITVDDLVLFGDCYYLPHREGPRAEALYQSARALLTETSSRWGGQEARFLRQAARLREFCVRTTELRYRPLFHALSRRVWELREELDLLEGYVRFASQDSSPSGAARSDFHLPGTYRGGIVARLQRLLIQQADGSFVRADRAVKKQRELAAAVEN
jgi:protein O-GlcNAcase / histone acetyltransferase